MRFWTCKFVGALVVVVALIADARWYPLDPYTGKPQHLLDFTDSGVAPFIFLLSLLYVISHAGGWALARFRGASLGSVGSLLRRGAAWARALFRHPGAEAGTRAKK